MKTLRGCQAAADSTRASPPASAVHECGDSHHLLAVQVVVEQRDELGERLHVLVLRDGEGRRGAGQQPFKSCCPPTSVAGDSVASAQPYLSDAALQSDESPVVSLENVEVAAKLGVLAPAKGVRVRKLILRGKDSYAHLSTGNQERSSLPW